MLLALALTVVGALAEEPAATDAPAATPPSVTEAHLSGPKLGEHHLALLSGGAPVGKVWLKVAPSKKKGTFEIATIVSERAEEGPPRGHKATWTVDSDLAVLEGVSEEYAGDTLTSRTVWRKQGRSFVVEEEANGKLRRATVPADRPLHTGFEVGFALAEALAAKGIGQWSLQELSWDEGAEAPVWVLSKVDVTGPATGGERRLDAGTVRVIVDGEAHTEVLVGADGVVAEISVLGTPTQLLACPPDDLVACKVIADQPDEAMLRDAFAAVIGRAVELQGTDAMTKAPGDLLAAVGAGDGDVARVASAARGELSDDTRGKLERLRGLVRATVKGDAATVELLGGTLTLVHVDGRWQVPATP